MQAVTQVFEDITPMSNLSVTFPVVNLSSPVEAKRYLTRNHRTCCVLVIDAETIKDAYRNLPTKKVEYEELLETAATKVGKTAVEVIHQTRETMFHRDIQAPRRENTNRSEVFLTKFEVFG